jgi:hypothetical protein
MSCFSYLLLLVNSFTNPQHQNPRHSPQKDPRGNHGLPHDQAFPRRKDPGQEAIFLSPITQTVLRHPCLWLFLMYIPYSFKRWNLIALPMCVRLTASSESNTAKLMACPSEIRLWKDWLLCWYLFFSLSHHLSVISHPEGLQLYELPWT